MMAATTYNCHRGKKDKPAKIKDFLPQWRKEELSDEEQAERNRIALNQALGLWQQSVR